MFVRETAQCNASRSEHNDYSESLREALHWAVSLIKICFYSEVILAYAPSVLCWDLRHTLRKYRQGPFVE
jgi:hypothetical protein